MLEENPQRKFIYVEQAFFYRWWNEQNPGVQQTVRNLVAEDRLVFINGGWCMNDEATTHYTAIIDQMSLGAENIYDLFGKVNTIGWHIDPFGHSNSHPALFTKMGFNAFFFSRIDYQDYALRNESKRLEMVWRGMKSYGKSADMFTSVMYDGYGPPTGFDFEWADGIAIQEDDRLFDYNIDSRADAWAKEMRKRSLAFRTNNIMIAFGSDFQYSNANVMFKNMDKLMRYINSKPYGLNMFYSTPAIYADYVHKANLTWDVKTDDFFPYADKPHAYWTGYFTSRASLKGMVRHSTNVLHAVDNLFSTSGLAFSQEIDTSTELDRIFRLAEAHAVTQHHDAVAGTEQQHVADDYALRLSVGFDHVINTFTNVISRLSQKSSSASLPPFEFCPLINQSICDPLQKNNFIPFVIYNPLAWDREEFVSIPVQNLQGILTVFDQNGSKIPISQNQFSNYQIVSFKATVPGLGFGTFFLENTHLASPRPQAKPKSIQSSESSEGIVVLENDYVKLDWGFDFQLRSFTNKKENITIKLTQTFLWYNASAGNNNASDQASGAYIFRPNGTTPFEINAKPSLSLTQFAFYQEMKQVYANWVTVIFRLWPNSSHVEVESTIGYIPLLNSPNLVANMNVFCLIEKFQLTMDLEKKL